MRYEKKFNKLVGKMDGQYIFLDYVFRDGDGFKGMVGTAMEVYTKDEAEWEEEKYRLHNRSDNFDDGYIGYLKYSHDEDCTYNDWVDMVKSEQQYSQWDDSYRYKDRWEKGVEFIKEKEGNPDLDSECSNCTGGGRMYSSKYLCRDNWEWVDEEFFEDFKLYLLLYEIL